MSTWQITSPYFCAGLVVNDRSGRVQEAAPILAKTIGRKWYDVLQQYKRYGHKIEQVSA